MLEREIAFTHRLGGVLDLPLLIPSFSSKGFDFFEKGRGRNKRIYSDTTYAIELMGPYLQESFLISAYDLYHEHLRKPDTYFENTAVILLDSGGYELNPDFDSSEPKLTCIRKLPFTSANYENLLDELYEKHSDIPFVITNFDWDTRNSNTRTQIRKARRLFGKYPNWSRNFLLKPSEDSSVIHVDDLVPHISDFTDFDVVGITEKEIGKNLLDRLKLIANLRDELNRRNVRAPIHVWGGLDPVMTPLYFFAGADIFDGVSWLRYVYHEGRAVNRQCANVLDGSLTTSHDHSVMLALNKNHMYLQALGPMLRAFAASEEPKFDVFDSNREILEKAYATMRAKIPQLGEER